MAATPGGHAASASREFQVFAKPVGAICNLACSYCYYLDKRHFSEDGASPRMTDDILESYIVQHVGTSPGTVTTFTWHGGEPTLLGVDYFRMVVALQEEHRPAGHTILNSLQTNGMLVDEGWCRLFSEARFTIGLSMDGPAEFHDMHRVSRAGDPTHSDAMRAYRLLREHRVPCDILCVVHAGNVAHPAPVYRFFREIGAEYMSFIPLVEPVAGGGVSDRTVGAEAWGEFLCAVFGEWLSRDIGRMQVQIIEEVARAALGHPHALCVFRPECGDVPAVERTGDVYSCDHFVDAHHRLGNIMETPLAGLLESRAQRAFGAAKSETLPRCCTACDVLRMCHGGCPKDRILSTPDGEPGLNYLCAGYKRFFRRCRPFARELARQSRGHGK